MMRVLLVDDEQDLIWGLQHSLSGEGYEVFSAYDGVEALSLTRRHHPDLVILDMLMPRLDGLSVCRILRQDPTLSSVPILFLSVRGTTADRIRGLREGADDYLPKPFDLRELKARIKALLRRVPSTPEESMEPDGRAPLLTVGPLTLDLHTRQVRVKKKVVKLTPIEFDLLHYLMTHPREIFSSKQLMKQVWNYHSEVISTGPVRWHIGNLRAKIEPDPDHPIYIRTVPHHGYGLDLLDEHTAYL